MYYLCKISDLCVLATFPKVQNCHLINLRTSTERDGSWLRRQLFYSISWLVKRMGRSVTWSTLDHKSYYVVLCTVCASWVLFLLFHLKTTHLTIEIIDKIITISVAVRWSSRKEQLRTSILVRYSRNMYHMGIATD